VTIKGNPVPAPTFSPPPSQYNQQWQSTFNASLQRKLGLLAGPWTVQPQVLLQSPNGGTWQVTVSDAGTLTATQITDHGKQPPL
jgi:hypothetical protein